jgi:hypothetical protein
MVRPFRKMLCMLAEWVSVDHGIPCEARLYDRFVITFLFIIMAHACLVYAEPQPVFRVIKAFAKDRNLSVRTEAKDRNLSVRTEAKDRNLSVRTELTAVTGVYKCASCSTTIGALEHHLDVMPLHMKPPRVLRIWLAQHNRTYSPERSVLLTTLPPGFSTRRPQARISLTATSSSTLTRTLSRYVAHINAAGLVYQPDGNILPDTKRGSVGICHTFSCCSAHVYPAVCAFCCKLDPCTHVLVCLIDSTCAILLRNPMCLSVTCSSSLLNDLQTMLVLIHFLEHMFTRTHTHINQDPHACRCAKRSRSQA